jgi:branched-chain amino acid transport system substrate-binding protein
MKAAGTDTIITGNWGADLALLVKAANDAGLNANFYTYYAGTTGVGTQMGASGENRVRQVSYWNPNDLPTTQDGLITSFKQKHNDDYYTMATYTGIKLLSEAFKKTKSTDPIQVAFAMEGMKVMLPNGEAEMRATDHQLQQNVTISSWQKVDGKSVRHDVENTGYSWKTVATLDSYIAAQPTSCNMKRPAKR